MRNRSQSIIIRTLNEINTSKMGVISIPERFMNVEKEGIGTIKISSLEEKVHFKSNRTHNEIEITPALQNRLGLFDGLTCQAIFKDHTLRLGPVVGAFVAQSYINKLLAQKPKMRTMELVKANVHAQIMLYFFSKDGIHFKHKKAKGVYYDHDTGQWKSHNFPYADVIYDRGSGRVDARKSNRVIRNKFEKESNVQRLNAEHYFDKWELHKRLNKYQIMQPYLPFTMLYRHAEDIETCLRKYKTIYIKQCVGSNGRKIMKVEQHPHDMYTCRIFTNKVITHHVKGINKVKHYVNKIYKRYKTLVQEAIDLPTYQRRIVDMRATVQRDGFGKLHVTAIAVRVAGNKSPVTSTRTGAKCYRFEDFYTNIRNQPKQKVRKLKSKINKFLYHVYKHTEKSYGFFGEIGIDFALDRRGNLKLVECNAKPAKSALYQSYDQRTIRRAFQYPLEYAKYISNM